jgi:hypothetical protein
MGCTEDYATYCDLQDYRQKQSSYIDAMSSESGHHGFPHPFADHPILTIRGTVTASLSSYSCRLPNFCDMHH